MEENPAVIPQHVGDDFEITGFPISMAFQPIVNTAERTIYGYEALVRGVAGESAESILSQVTDANKHLFDQACRVTAIEVAAGLNVAANLHINFLPNARYSPETCAQATLEAGEKFGIAPSLVTLEIVESEKIHDLPRVKTILAYYKEMGFRMALDDFGEAYSGLNLLTELLPDIVKLDMKLIRGIDHDRVRQAIVRGLVSVCNDLEITPIGEGVETLDESNYLTDHGISLQQGYFYARPAFEKLPASTFVTGSCPA